MEVTCKNYFFCFILPALISNHLVDTTCLEGSTIVMSCEVSVEDIDGVWYKDDSRVVQSSQIYPTVNGRIHQLNIFQSEIKDGGKYVFKIRDKISSGEYVSSFRHNRLFCCFEFRFILKFI